MKKLRRKQIIAFVLALCLCLGMLPADMLGGIGTVVAAEETDASGIKRTIDEASNTTTWDFTGTSSETKMAGKSILGLTGSDAGSDSNGIRTKSGYMSLFGPNVDSSGNEKIRKGVLAIDLDSATTSVELTIDLNSAGGDDTKYGTRYVTVGNDTTNLSIWHKDTDASGNAQANNFAGENNVWTGTFDSSYFTGDTLVITAGVGETKIDSIKIVETKSAGGSVSENEGESTLVVEKSKSYSFLVQNEIDTSILGGGWSYNGGQHGIYASSGTTITLPVTGATTFVFGGCSSTNGGTVTVTDSASNVLVSAQNTKTDSCAGYQSAADMLSTDASKTWKVEYTGEADTLTFTFAATTYIPWLTMYWEEEVDMSDWVSYNRTYDFGDGSVAEALGTKGDAYTVDQVSTDGKVTVAAGAKWNDAQHGIVLGNGQGSVAIKVAGPATITATKCQYTSGGVTASLTKGSELIGEAQDATVAACGTETMSWEYTGGEAVLVLTCSGTTYLKSITVAGKEPLPNEISANISINSGADLLGAGNVVLTNSGDPSDVIQVPVAGRDNVTLSASTTYNLTTDVADTKALVADKTSVTTGTSAMDIAVDVVSTVVNPTVGLATGAVLPQGATLTVTKEGSETPITLTVGNTVKLEIGAKYAIACSDASAEARVGGATSFTVTEDMTALTVELISTSSVVTMTVDESGATLGSAKVVITNADDASDVQEFVDGGTVTLKLNNTYKLSCTDVDIFAKIDGKTSYTVTDAIDALTVVLSAAEYHKYDVYDFGGMQLENTTYNTYNNKWTVDTINSWFPGVAAGGSAKFGTETALSTDSRKITAIAEQKDKMWIRTKKATTGVTNIICGKDDRTWQDVEDSSIKYFSAFWSDGNATTKRYLNITVERGDIVTLVASRNNNESQIAWRSPSEIESNVTAGAEAQSGVTVTKGNSSNASSMTFYATESGEHKIYSVNDKLIVCRIYVESPETVSLSGTLDLPDGTTGLPSGAKLVFTQDKTGAVIEAPINGSTYSVDLQNKYAYSVALKGANGYIIDESIRLNLETAKAGNMVYDREVFKVELATVTGSLADLTAEHAADLTLRFTPTDSSKVYIPEFTVTAGTNNFTAILEKDVTYTLKESGVDDYTLETATIVASADTTKNIQFLAKPKYAVNVTVEGPSAAQAANIEFCFERVADDAVNGEVDGYCYDFTGTNGITLRDGQYKIKATLDGWTQVPTADVKVNGAAASATVKLTNDSAVPSVVPFAESVTVGTNGDYQTINEALDAISRMERDSENPERVTVYIEPGDYEEMLRVTVDNVTFKNASATPSIALTNKGVDIDENAVRITGYYGHGYAYASMDDEYKWNADVFAANKSNGYYTTLNPGAGSATMWNASVQINANGFQAEDIIFENSFNQYISEKAAADDIYPVEGTKEGAVPRADMAAGDVTVQDKAYVERATALAIGNAYSDIVFDNCKFVGRQDVLYGGKGTYAEFNQCSIYGACDYIFGGMIAIFNQCDLVFNTSDNKEDVGYITAPQQATGRGYLMYECRVTSTTPGVDTASEYPSKPGYFGRPWGADTTEAVFYNTTIDATHEHWVNAVIKTEDKDNYISTTKGPSLITPEGWLNTLAGESAKAQEYGTIELSGVDNSASRASWATVLTEPVMTDGVEISFEAFRKPVPVEGLYQIDLTQGLKAGVTYDGGLSVLEDMAMKSDGYIQGSGNPVNSEGKNPQGGVPVSGAAVILNAQKNGYLRMETKEGGKTTYCVDATSGKTIETYAQAASGTRYKSYKVEAGHQYYVYAGGSKLCIYSIAVDYRDPFPWDTVATPVLGVPTVDNAEGTITVPFDALVGGLNSEYLEVRMIKDGEIADSIEYVEESESGSVTFSPSASGAYTFVGILRREGVQGKESNTTAAVDFILPMRDPVIVNVENQGGGAVKFSWNEVAEAEKYEVYLNGELKQTVTVPYARFEGLTIGQEYEFGVKALGNNDVSEMSTMSQTVSGEAMKSWLFSAFGQGVDTKNNLLLDGIDGKDDKSAALQSLGGKGKLVPASTDGLAFYYTTIDPNTENFTLSADITVDEWTYTNGQEGFGIMAADTVGAHGDSSVFWNNSYMVSATKVEYYWNGSEEMVADSGTKYSMKLGVGSQEKIGVTKENLADIQGGNLTDFVTAMTTLETSAPYAELPAGTYNIVGNYTNDVDLGTYKNQTTFHMTLQRNNTGYFLSYTDENGKTVTNKYYHDEETGDALTHLDPHNIYVGFFASRQAKITVDNISLTTIDPAKDAPAEARPITYVTPNYTIESSKYANSADYELVYYGNADVTIDISLAGETLVEGVKVKAEEKYRLPVTIKKGYNSFKIFVQPDKTFKPSKYERLSDYGWKEIEFGTRWDEYETNVVYVSPDGEEGAKGDRNNPMDIYNAVQYVRPGDMIVLMEGTYEMNRSLTIDRGINGTASDYIYMIADPEASTRPVIDFGRMHTGMVLAGDYWYLQGFDVTRSANGQKGVQISGSYNVVDDLHTYRNGNTGIQISRFKGSDLWEDWPAHNLILNCTSYLNADAGYEDADGFAAKLTVGEGNVFDGCVAAYNADDGWDLFAKIESGLIGQVKIINSVAFKNGYDIDENGNEINAGNGNGFKMGGSSMSGQHILYNSIAFANKAKGIDSNSCPDIMAYSSTSFDNGSYNVAFYTNDAKNTAFYADGVLSYKKSNTEGDNLKYKGMQDESGIYSVTNYYYNGIATKNSEGNTADDSWFVNLDTEAAVRGGITRNADGTLNMNGYLELTSAVPDGVGARLSGGTPSRVIEIPDTIYKGNYDASDDDDDEVVGGGSAEAPEAGGSGAGAAAPEAPAEKPAEAPADKPADSNTEIIKELVVDVEVDWDMVQDALKELIAEAAGKKAVLSVALGDYQQMPKDVLIDVMGLDVTLRLSQTSGVVWEINGKDIKNPTDIDLLVDCGSKAIPEEALSIFEGLGELRQFSIAHDGDFGASMKLKFPTDKKNDGKFANLFYYNPDGAYEFIASSKCDSGYAEFTMDHASDYVIVISDAAMKAVPEVQTEGTGQTEQKEPANAGTAAGVEVGTEAAQSGNMVPIILIILAVLIAAGVIAVVVMRKKREQ